MPFKALPEGLIVSEVLLEGLKSCEKGMRKMPEDHAELDAEDHIKAHKITTIKIYSKFTNGTCTGSELVISEI